MPQRFGILGGTFNPIHYGHLAAAEEIHDRLKLDQVLFIPSFFPPHKQEEDILSAAQRLEMVRLAVAGNAHFAVSDIEVRREGRSYTIDTINELRSINPAAEFYFMMGLDSFLEIQSWSRWDRLLTLCAFVVLSRPGYRFCDLQKIDFMRAGARELDEMDKGVLAQAVVRPGPFTIFLETIPHYDISSTDIRKRIRQSRTIKYLLPEAVEHYIITHKLYG